MLQECRQYKVLIKDQQENRKEDWVKKALQCQDGESSSASDSSTDKKRPKRKHEARRTDSGGPYLTRLYMSQMLTIACLVGLWEPALSSHHRGCFFQTPSSTFCQDLRSSTSHAVQAVQERDRGIFEVCGLRTDLLFMLGRNFGRIP